MRKALYILGDLAEEDVVFLSRAGDVVELDAGATLVRAGEPPQALYFVTSGALDVQVGGGVVVAHLGVGDVVGEMSFVENRAPDASVVASEPSRLLAVPRAALEAELGRNPAFAGRFYKALATFLSDRLRTLTAEQAGDSGAAAELDERLLDIVHVAGDRMARIIAMLEGEQR